MTNVFTFPPDRSVSSEGFHPIEVDFKLKAPLCNEIFSVPVNKTQISLVHFDALIFL